MGKPENIEEVINRDLTAEERLAVFREFVVAREALVAAVGRIPTTGSLMKNSMYGIPSSLIHDADGVLLLMESAKSSLGKANKILLAAEEREPNGKS